MADLTNSYETIIIVSAKNGEETNVELIEKFKERINRHGTVESVDNWGKRRLAYPINKENEGYYTLINFSSTPDFTAELDRRYKITDGIIRTLIIKKDPRHNKPSKAKAKKADDAAVIDVEAIEIETAVETVAAE